MPNIGAFDLQQEFLIVGAAAQTGLFDAIKNNPLTVEELSDRTGCDQRALWTVTEALVALEYLNNEDGKLRLTEAAYSTLYDSTSESYAGFSFMHTYNLISTWLKLPEVLKTGEPAHKENIKEDPARLNNFIVAMSHYARESAAQVADYCLQGLAGSPRVLDVGGGPLTYALALTQKGAVVTVLDLPEVIDMMKPELDPALPIRMEKGDFTVGLPKGPFDLVYLGNVCHIYGEKENRKLFTDASNELVVGGRIVINDMLRGTGPEPSLFAVNMLLNTASGGTWTFEQYKTWLEDAGLAVFGYDEVADVQLITATKK